MEGCASLLSSDGSSSPDLRIACTACAAGPMKMPCGDAATPGGALDLCQRVARLRNMRDTDAAATNLDGRAGVQHAAVGRGIRDYCTRHQEWGQQWQARTQVSCMHTSMSTVVGPTPPLLSMRRVPGRVLCANCCTF